MLVALEFRNFSFQLLIFRLESIKLGKNQVILRVWFFGFDVAVGIVLRRWESGKVGVLGLLYAISPGDTLSAIFDWRIAMGCRLAATARGVEGNVAEFITNHTVNGRAAVFGCRMAFPTGATDCW